MRIPNRFVLIVGSLLSALSFFSCLGPSQLAQGNGSETVAIIQGRIVTPEGLSAQGAQIRLLPSNFNPVTEANIASENQAIADSGGAFSFAPKISRKTHYNLEIRYSKTSMSLMHSNINLLGDKAVFPMDTLRMPGAVTLRLPSGTAEGYLLMRGTTRTVLIDDSARSRGTVLLDSIPAGSVGAIEFSPKSEPSITTILTDTLTVFSKNMNVRGNLLIYTDKSSLVTGTWVAPLISSVIEDSVAVAFDGIKSYRFDYVFDTTNSYAGFGLNLDNWWRGATYDLSHCTKIIAAYKGMTGNQGVYIQLRDNNAVSNNVRIGGPSDAFVHGEALLSAFSGVNLSQIREIIFGLTDPKSKSGAGTIWIDNVEVEY